MRASFFELTCVLAALARRERLRDEQLKGRAMTDDQAAEFFDALVADSTARKERPRQLR